MFIINKKIEEISESDIQVLIDEEKIEKKVLEYKSELPGNSDSDKKDFLAEVSSFSNTLGGDIIYGVIENRDIGKPEKLEGIKIENIDQEILRIENIIRNGIEPNIPSSSINVIEIPLKNLKCALIIRIKKSWLSPHRISFRSWHRFYARSTNGKYPLDVQELKYAFLLSESIGQKINQFRERRVSDIYANNLPIPFYKSPKIVLHIIPFSAFNPRHSFDFKDLSLYDIQPMNSTNFQKRYNIDGLLTFSYYKGRDVSHSYVQLYRNGIIEAVNSRLLWSENKEKCIPINSVETVIVESVSRYIQVYKKCNLTTPIFLFLTLINVKDYVLSKDGKKLFHNIFPIDREIVLIPEIIIEDYDVDPPILLKPIFDLLWNACGFEKSLNYTKNGTWKL